MRQKRALKLVAVFLGLSGFAYLLAGAAFPERQSGRNDQKPSIGNKQVTDQNSMQQMMRSMMSGVVPAGINPGDLPEPGSEGAKLVVKYCV
ncbi:MAG: hypothetical protein ACRD3T_17025 [Terriglobia bacterium]